MLCLCWGTGSDLGKGCFPKCKYSHTASKENLWEMAPRLAFALLSPQHWEMAPRLAFSLLSPQHWDMFSCFHFCSVVDTVWGQLCLLLLPKKFPYHGTFVLASWKKVCIFCLFRRWRIRRVFIKGNVTSLCVWQFLGNYSALETCAIDAKTTVMVVKVYVFISQS